MLNRFFIWITQRPLLRRVFWRLWYNHWSRQYGEQDGWEFMNYGYSPIDPDEPKPELQPEDENRRNWIQLYHQIASRIDLTGKTMVEVGSGRGGGSSYVHRYLKPAETIGIDLSDVCVEHCNQKHKLPGLSFRVGDAMNLPLEDGSVDVVLNVESSHAYPSRDTFFREASRVLRAGGHFLFTDLVEATELEDLEASLEDAGFRIEHKTQINSNVLKALDENEVEKKELFAAHVSPRMAGMFSEFAGYEGSTVLMCLRSGYVVYYRYVLQKI